MRRPPVFTKSQWARSLTRQSRSWDMDANCAGRHDLPWTSEEIPPMDSMVEMGIICRGCTVLVDCARYALTSSNGNGVEGGFYAGVWVPWVSRESSEAKIGRKQSAP